jgi:EAL domain-containing protein (putative c-di-GMP-specific phosphodiesterase class I)
VSTSIGVAPVPFASKQPLSHALATAEIACKAAKDRGRDRVESFHDADQSILRRHAEVHVVASLREALAADRFRLYAQPILPLAIGPSEPRFEILLRLQSESGELLPPGKFLPAAERYQLIGDIDRWVVRRAAQLAATGMAVELNLSGASLSDPGFAGVVERELRDAGADPSLVVVEVTETALVTNEEAAAAFVKRITELGCRMALDDFGTGYGGFSYLKRLPVHFLKIDREFVRDALADAGSRHVVKAVVDLARGFGQKTVAEGVEDRATLQLLGRLGVDFAQGFGIARPHALDDDVAVAA